MVGSKINATEPTIPHNPNLKLTWSLPYDFDPAADCPTFLKWLDYVTNGNSEIKLLLQAYMNAIVRGYNIRQVYVELLGPGGSGKSTFMTICSKLVGAENTVSTELKQLEGNRFETANLFDKRLALITDSSKFGGNVDTLRALTGGDLLRFEEKNKQAGQGFVFGGLVLIAANQAIRSTDYTSGLARRRLTVGFNRKIKEELLPNDYYNKMMAEIPGILNWCLNLPNVDVDNILTGSTTTRCKQIGIVKSNPVAQWMNETLAYKPGARVRIGKDNEEHWFCCVNF